MLPSLPKARTGMAAASAALLLAVAGCATPPSSPGTVTYQGTRSASTVRSGIITSVTPVTIQPDNTYIATGTGAVLGGIAGSTIGRNGSAGEAAATVGGAVLGGIIGNAIGRSAGTRQGFAYVVEFGNGEVREIVQASDQGIAPGTPVNVVFRQDGVIITPAASQPAY